MGVKTIAITGAWVACSLLSFGIANGDWRGEFPNLITPGAYDGVVTAKNARRSAHENCEVAGALSVGGPITLPIIFLLSDFASDGLSYDCSPIQGTH